MYFGQGVIYLLNIWAIPCVYPDVISIETTENSMFVIIEMMLIIGFDKDAFVHGIKATKKYQECLPYVVNIMCYIGSVKTTMPLHCL